MSQGKECIRVRKWFWEQEEVFLCDLLHWEAGNCVNVCVFGWAKICKLYYCRASCCADSFIDGFKAVQDKTRIRIMRIRRGIINTKTNNEADHQLLNLDHNSDSLFRHKLNFINQLCSLHSFDYTLSLVDSVGAHCVLLDQGPND